MKLTFDSFVAVLNRSGLLTPEKLSPQLQAFQSQNPGAAAGQGFADYLVEKNVITSWQAEKLLQGKHKGFFLGKYRLLSLLGKGGMSSVYLAEHVLMRRRCAIKVLPAKRVNDTSYLGRFHREAQAVAALDHPNIVRAYDVDHERDGSVEIHFLVMEYVDGCSLLDMVNRDGPLDPVLAAEYIRQAALGLEHAHRAGLIHRDVKPGNLLVDQSGVVKVMDLGLARFFAGEDKESLTIQYDEKVLGTADYLAPEQAVDSHDIDARADIYSLGCTLYFLLVGHPPFTQGTLPQRLMAHQNKEPPPVSAERPEVPASLLAVMNRMLAKKPDDRYPTAGAASEALLSWLEANGGDRWMQIRARLAESGIEVPGSSSRISGDKNLARPEGAATGGGVPQKSSSDVKPRPKPAQAAAPADEALGAFLSNLSGGPTPPARAEAAEAVAVQPRIEPARSARKSTAAVRRPAAAPAAEATVVEALPAEPVEAEPVLEAKAAAPVVVRRRKQGPSRLYVVFGGAAALVIAVVAAVLVFSGGEDQSVANGPTRVQETIAKVEPAVPTGSTRPSPESPTEITVGPEGNFATIGEAVAYALENPPLTNLDEPRLIRVAGGQTYPERIQLSNWNLGALHIKSEGDAPAILKPEGGEPVVAIDTSRRVKLEGLRIDASGRPDAIRLAGVLNGVQLLNLEITGFSRSGIFGERASGLRSGRLELRDLRLTGGSSEAAGVRFTSSAQTAFEGGTQYVNVINCRFGGPMRSGVEFDGALSNIVIQKCRFHDMQAAMRLQLGSAELDTLSIVNNTVHRAAQGIVMDGTPSAAAGITLQKNLFAELTGPELAVEGATDEARLQVLRRAIASAFNVTDHGADAVSSLPFDLFGNGGRAGVAPDFASVDMGNGGFLKPRNQELKAPQAPGGDKYIGAVSP